MLSTFTYFGKWPKHFWNAKILKKKQQQKKNKKTKAHKALKIKDVHIIYQNTLKQTNKQTDKQTNKGKQTNKQKV